MFELCVLILEIIALRGGLNFDCIVLTLRNPFVSLIIVCFSLVQSHVVGIGLLVFPIDTFCVFEENVDAKLKDEDSHFFG